MQVGEEGEKTIEIHKVPLRLKAMSFTAFSSFRPRLLLSFGKKTHECNHIVVWNPSISQHVTIPKPEDSRHGPRYLGYDPFGDTYKLLWGTPKHYGLTVSWKCISGVMYHEAYTDNNKYMEIRTIMSFKVRLALVCPLDTKLWILEDEKEDEWVCNIDLHLPIYRTDPTGKINYRLNDATVTGEFIYVAVDDKEVHILYYDPKKNNTRSFKFEGSMYKEFEGFGGGACQFNIGCIPNLKGLAYRKSSSTFARCLPNHIENLISLKNITCSKLV
ncbi:BnaC05g01760D [Brassica napus]|uniref:BnaC05g01760D protein n=2 Tax=Brassica napus TaxID=3708 RepID=A0A078G0L5_BRANA|nr:BnaC05g01760D [Brassica napus]